MYNYKIGRLVSSKANPTFGKLLAKLVKRLREENASITYFIFPGGFFELDIDKRKITTDDFEENYLNDKIGEAFQKLPKRLLKEIKKRVKFFSIGIDGIYENNRGNIYPIIQTVVLYSNTLGKMVQVTGKSYPTVTEAKKLIRYPIKTHFYQYYSDRILILGCHDLKMFSNRAKKSAGEERLKIIRKFKRLVREYKPNIVLHHPHFTNTYKTWNVEWRYLERSDEIEGFGSGIYYDRGQEVDVEKIIEKSESEDVFTLRY